MTQDMITLGFDQIIIQLQEQAVSRPARQRLAETEPILNEGLCIARMAETTAARQVIESAGLPPLAETDRANEGVIQAAQGSMLLPVQLTSISRFCGTIHRLRLYLQKVQITSAGIASWHTELPDLNELGSEIDGSIREDAILDDASPTLRNLRRQREHTEQAIREKLNQILLHHKKELADSYITQRNSVYVLPVQ